MADGTYLNYQAMVERALRNVLRAALREVAEKGLPGEHHFYITFHTRHPGVEIPETLRSRYPEEMTIVLQHKFWSLEVEDQRFAVTLSFSGQPNRLVVPFEAVSSFADPSVRFMLQFESATAEAVPEEPAAPEAVEAPSEVTPLPKAAPAAKKRVQKARAQAGTGEDPAVAAPEETENIVALDRFRKK